MYEVKNSLSSFDGILNIAKQKSSEHTHTHTKTRETIKNKTQIEKKNKYRAI